MANEYQVKFPYVRVPKQPPALPRNSNAFSGPWTYHQLRIYFRLKSLAVVLASVGGAYIGTEISGCKRSW